MKAIKKYKTILLGQTMMVLAMCVCGFTACGDDADEQPMLPSYQEVSAKYVATDEKAALQIVELTADAHYIVAAQNGNEGTDVGYGTYSILDAGRYLLKDYGSVEVKDLGSGAYALTVTPNEGKVMQLHTTDRKQIEGGTLTSRLVGAWKMTALQVQLERNGKTFTKTVSDGEWDTLEKELRAWAQQFGDEADHDFINQYTKDLMEEYRLCFSDFLFTRFGTYLVFRGQQSECAWWQWEDEKEGLLRFSWTEGDLYDKEESGTVRIAFDGDRLCIAQDFSGFFSETVTNICEAMK